MPLEPLEILKYLEDTQSPEEKNYLESPQGQEDYKQFKQLWESFHEQKH